MRPVHAGREIPRQRGRDNQTLSVTVDRLELPGVPGLATEVVGRLVAELGGRGEKVVSCLRTAAVFLEQAREDGSDGLRLAESAAYNLREAFDAVVEGQPAPEGGLGDVIDAWKRYEIAVQASDPDVEAARTELDRVLRRLAQDEERQGFRTRQLLDYIRDQAGIEPLAGEGDPSARYNRLRQRAARSLHTDATVAGVSTLYDEAIVWFGGFFTPPDDRVHAIVALAERPYVAGLIREARELVINAHHLRLLLSRLRDPEWLEPLYDAGFIPMPRAGEPWPVMSLGGGTGAIDPVRIAGLLQRLLNDSMTQSPQRRIEIAREIVTCASRLGPVGHSVAQQIIAKHPGDHWVQMVAVSISKAADATAPIQLAVARAIVGNQPAADRGYYTGVVLERLADGLTAENAADRMKMVAANIRRLAAADEMRFTVIDIAALPTEAGDDLHEPVLILAHHFTKMIPRAREHGVPTSDMLAMVDRIPGELGERIGCQVLAGANDVDRDIKIGHIARRIASQTATGDDRDLIYDILATATLSPDELGRWRTAFGQPSPAPDPITEPDRLGDNWPRAWRWSMVLPGDVLEGWDGAIAAVSARHGEPTPSSLDTRIPRSISVTGRSPYPHDEIADLSVADATALVSAWRPQEGDEWGVSARELARALETIVKANLDDWTMDPTMVVTTLREPIYIDHYFRAVKEHAAQLADRTTDLLAAVKLVRTQRWDPTPLGHDDYDYEPDWSVVDMVTIDMIASFASHDSDLAQDLSLCWEQATDMVRRLPDDLPDLVLDENGSRIDAPLNRAINRPYGKALAAVLALAGWEHRNQGGVSGRLPDVLDDVLGVPGAVGLELRAVLVSRRPLLEVIAIDWLEANAAKLFGTDPLGVATFDQTLLWSRPTRWFYDYYQAELVAAARRGADNAASWLLIALLWEEPGYTFQTIVDGFRANVHALTQAADRMAALMQDVDADDPKVDRGLAFWDDMLTADRNVVPAKALAGLGRWAFVDAVDDERFLELVDRTLAITGGNIEMATEIADRCKNAQPSSKGLRALRMMIGHGDLWEQHHIETAGVEALQIAASHPIDLDEFDQLRARLIERGRHEAADITPVPAPSPTARV